MTTPDLQALWNTTPSRPESGTAKNQIALRTRLVLRTRGRLGVHGLWTLAEAVVAAALSFLTGTYLLDHLEDPWLSSAAFAVLIHLAYAVWSGAREAIELGRIDFDQPISTLQVAILRIRSRRYRAEKRLFLLGLFTWLPAGLILLAAIGVDVMAAAPPTWILANLACAAVLALTAQALSRRWVEIETPGRLGQKILDGMTGRRLRAALAALEDWERIESEPDPEADRFLR